MDESAIVDGVEIKQGATGTIETKEGHVFIRALTSSRRLGCLPEMVSVVTCVKSIERTKKTIVHTNDFLPLGWYKE